MTVPIRGERAIWYSEGALTNPTTAMVLADTGQIATVQEYLAYILYSTNATAELNIEHRNAANNAVVGASPNIESQTLYLAASDHGTMVVPVRTTAANERLRVIPNANVTGKVHVTIHFQKVS